MTHTLRTWIRAGLVPVTLCFLSLAAGCSSEPKPGPGGEAGAPRKKFIPLAGQEVFFDGQIFAEIHVGTEGMPEVKPGNSGGGGGGGGSGGNGDGGRRHGGGGGRMNLAGGTGGFGGNIAGSVPFGEGGSRSREGGPGGGPRLGGMGGGGRPVMIHLRFTNRTAATVDLYINDFVSPLGNFAVRPEKLTIEPGQSLETEPMTSQLAGAFTEALATLVLRVNGKVEKKMLPLKQVAPPAETATTEK